MTECHDMKLSVHHTKDIHSQGGKSNEFKCSNPSLIDRGHSGVNPLFDV